MREVYTCKHFTKNKNRTILLLGRLEKGTDII